MRMLFNEVGRSFLGLKFVIGIMGVAFAYYLSVYKIYGISSSVYSSYRIAINYIPFVISLTFCAMSSALGFCEDLEYNYILQVIIRGGLKKYVFFRVTAIFMTAIIVMVLGTLLFVIVARIQVPWISTQDMFEDDLLAGMLTKHYILYYIIRSFYTGMLATCIAVLSAYVSLYWRSRFFALTIPFLVYCIVIYYTNVVFIDIPRADIGQIFDPTLNLWGNIALSLIVPVGIGVFFVVTIGGLMYIKLRELLYEKIC
jgi:hypothetical protein